MAQNKNIIGYLKNIQMTPPPQKKKKLRPQNMAENFRWKKSLKKLITNNRLINNIKIILVEWFTKEFFFSSLSLLLVKKRRKNYIFLNYFTLIRFLRFRCKLFFVLVQLFVLNYWRHNAKKKKFSYNFPFKRNGFEGIITSCRNF